MKRLAALLCCLAAPVAADPVLTECGWQSSAAYVAEPWAENTATFADGAVRIAVLDTLEPAAEAFGLLILSPPYGETGERQCRVFGGFSGLSLEGLEAGYDPSIGLYLTLTGQVFLEDLGEFASAQVDVQLNQQSGEIDTFVTPYFE